MTIDEQIKILESNSEFERKEGDLQGCLNFKQLAEWLKDYKRLKEQEPCDDCIRRSDIGLTDFEIVMCDGDYKEGLKMLLEKIEKAPSVSPMLKMGKWNVTKEKDELYSNVCICSECGRSDVGAGDYCRWCGAKMQEVEG